jgi:hypothetical protein
MTRGQPWWSVLVLGTSKHIVNSQSGEPPLRYCSENLKSRTTVIAWHSTGATPVIEPLMEVQPERPELAKLEYAVPLVQ